jgi:hypothetical protein
MKRLITVAALSCSLVLAAGAMAAGSPLTGHYQTIIKGKSSALNGTWLMSISANGFYTLAKKPKATTLLVGGSSTVSGKDLTFADHQGPLACKAPGQYTFAMAGKTLKFTKVADTCSGRLALLGAAWTKLG